MNLWARGLQRMRRGLVGWPPLLYLLVFFAIPTLIMVGASFRYPGDYGGLLPLLHQDCDAQAQCRWVWDIQAHNWHDYLTLDNYSRFFSDSIWAKTFFKSMLYAGATALICLLMAYPLSWTIARAHKKWADLLVLLVILPFWSNFLIRIYAWMILLGPQATLNKSLNVLLGWLGLEPVQLLHTPFAVLVGLVYVHLPFMVLPLYANLEKHDLSLLNAAQDLGANAWQRFWKVTFPLSLPGVYAGTALVFIPALGMFAIPELLGGPNDTLIGNLIKEQFRDARDWPFGSTLSIMLTLLVLIMAGAGSWWARRARATTSTKD